MGLGLLKLIDIDLLVEEGLGWTFYPFLFLFPFSFLLFFPLLSVFCSLFLSSFFGATEGDARPCNQLIRSHLPICTLPEFVE